MKVSKNSLASYSIPEDFWFRDRIERDQYFINHTGLLEPGIFCAVGGTPQDSDDALVWELELYNGTNWTVQNTDPNYLLVITNDGLRAITIARNHINADYQIRFTGIKIKQNNIVNPSNPLINWRSTDFEREGDIILNTFIDEANFSMDNNFSWRSNLANGGIQFTIKINSDTYGTVNGQRIEEYSIGAIGLYVEDPLNPGSQVLFAIGNLSEKIPKYSTTPTRIGNSIKLLLNTVITNLGSISNITNFEDSVNSIAEVQTEGELPSNAITSAYNVYLVNNYAGTNVPAIAIRKGNPTSAGSQVTWEFLTPKDDTITVDPQQIAVDVQDYMVATWDPNVITGDSSVEISQITGTSLQNIRVTNISTFESQLPELVDTTLVFTYNSDHWLLNGSTVNLASYSIVYTGTPVEGDRLMAIYYAAPRGQFVKAQGHNLSNGALVSDQTSNNLTGIKIGNTIIFAGDVVCYDITRRYNFTLNNPGQNYLPGDVLIYSHYAIPGDPTTKDAEFRLTVNTIEPGGAVSNYGFTVEQTFGIAGLEITGAPFENYSGSMQGDGLTVDITSGEQTDAYIWQFDSSWLNGPLYVSNTEPGKFTNIETDYFIGWCTGTGNKSSIRLALDLGDEASYTDYGTTRYATNTETKDVANNQGVSEVTAVCPKNLQANYIQKTSATGNPGSAANTPINVDTYLKFNKTIFGKGVPSLPANFESNFNEDVSFYGLAYRAWWGDLAEFYKSDKIYPAGTLITVGCGPNEITKAVTECNGIISYKPGYELGEKKDERDLPVALVGKVPVLFDRACMPKFGDRIYLSKVEPGKASNIPFGQCLGKIIDKAEDLSKKSTILCSVRISF